MRELAGTLWLLLPLLGAAGLHGLVLKYDWMTFLKRPVDAGLKLRGIRLFGANKTWRGVVGVSAGCAVVMGLQAGPLHRLEAVRAIELFDYGQINGWLLGAWVGALAELSELPNSFVKRRCGIAPGGHGAGTAGRVFFVWDQVDILLGFWLACPIFVDVTPVRVLISLLVLLAVHPLVTAVGYLCGMRRSAR